MTKSIYLTYHFQPYKMWECSDSVVKCLTRDQGAAGSSLTGVNVLCPWERHINPSLVLVQPRKTHPCITGSLLMGHKESNQTKQNLIRAISLIITHWVPSELFCLSWFTFHQHNYSHIRTISLFEPVQNALKVVRDPCQKITLLYLKVRV